MVIVGDDGEEDEVVDVVGMSPNSNLVSARMSPRESA